MGFYLSFKYLQELYGTNTSVPGPLIPQDLQFYRTTTDNIYVFHWNFTEDSYTPALKNYIYELDLDTVPTFDSPDLQIYGLQVIQQVVQQHIAVTSASSTTIGATSLNLVPNSQIGNVALIQSGTGSGQLRRIVSNTSTVLTVENTWQTIPDGSSVLMIYQSNVLNFQNGNVAKGYEIQTPNRLENPGQTYYARVRTLSNSVPQSSYSGTLQLSLLDRYDLAFAEAAIENLPDEHIYNKDVLKLSVPDRTTLLWKIMLMYGIEADRAAVEQQLTITDNYLTLTRDEKLYDNFGVYFNFIKPSTMQFVEYRRELENLMDAALHGGTPEAIMEVVRCGFTGVSPTVTTIRDIADFYLTTIREQTVATGTTNVFPITQNPSFLTETFRVVQEGSINAVYAPGASLTPLPNIPEFILNASIASGDTITAFYDISIPPPYIFDPTDGISISGVVGLTNGDADVFGTGTSFTTDLNIGDEISDGQTWAPIQFITSNSQLTLSYPWPGLTEVVDVLELNYTDAQIPPPTIWDKSTEAFGIEVVIHNPGEFTLDENLIETLVALILPSHVKVFYTFINN